MKQFPIIGVVGLPASGKTEVTQTMVNLDASRVRMGDVVWEETKRLGLDVNEENVGMVADELREREGPEAIARRCIPLARKKGGGAKAVVIDGIRGSSEVDAFKKAFGDDFYLISVEASEKTRFKRIGGRERRDDSSSWKAFREKDSRELKWGLKEAMELADFRLVNEGSLEELRSRATEIFEEVVE